ncbi:MAG TPA: XdhC family protein [Aggregatilineaceae bacterium]|nr:XdhC family protein [Aggregatilineaceae bacterium]
MNESLAVFEAVLKAQQEGLPAVLATVIRTQGSVPRQAGSKMLVWPDGRIEGTVGGGQMEAFVIQESQSAIQSGEPKMLRYELADLESGDPGVCGGVVELFIEPLVPAPTLLVIGCGHVGKAVAELAKWMQFRVAVADDRPGFATAEQIPGMDSYIQAPAGELLDHITINRFTYVAALTRGLPVDEKLLPLLLQTDAPYIGLIGSRRRWAMTVEALSEQGMSREQLARIHAPVGLELKAETPKEIAISILAEIVMVMRGGSGQPMQWMAEAPKSSGG